MKAFIQQLLLFLLPLIAGAYFIDRFLSINLQKSNTHAYKEYPTWNALLHKKVNSDVVIYGDSRAWVQFDPAIISSGLHASTFNLGIDGHNFWMQHLRHQLLLENNSKPRLIIHSVDAFTLQKREDLFNPDQFLPYMLNNEKIKKATISYKGYQTFDYRIPLIRYYGKKEAIFTALKLFIRPSDNPITRIRGYEGQNKTWNFDFEKAKFKMNTYTIKPDSASISLFDRYLSECVSKNIRVLLVYAPEYIEGQKFISNRNETIEIYLNMSEKYKIPFLDYSQDTLSFNRDYFYNSTHLNKTGAELFTMKLTDRIKKAKLFEVDSD
jgi:hypothetical protein